MEQMLTEERGEVGRTILQQIRAMDKWALGAWGAKDMVVFERGQIMKYQGKDLGAGVMFNVRGTAYRGKIMVVLNAGTDTYEVYKVKTPAFTLTNIAKNQLEPVITQVADDVYVDVLVQVLDRIIK